MTIEIADCGLRDWIAPITNHQWAIAIANRQLPQSAIASGQSQNRQSRIGNPQSAIAIGSPQLQNRQSAVSIRNPQSAISIARPQSQSSVGNRKIRSRQSAIRN
ncbi:MAG: hypothetical protein ACJ731_14500 [Vicinamibacterales bacterium]